MNHQPFVAHALFNDGIAPSPVSPLVHDGAEDLQGRLRGAVIMLGSFDGMHRGHRTLHTVASQLAQQLNAPLAILQCNPHPRSLFGNGGHYRVSTGIAQVQLIATVGVDFIYAPRFDAAFASQSAECFVRKILVGCLGVRGVVIGRDFRFGHHRSGDAAFLQARSLASGFELIVIDDQNMGGIRISTTQIRGLIAEGDIASANDLLGHEWQTEIHASQGGIWSFPAKQVLPPPGNWPVVAYDRFSRPLSVCNLTLRKDNTAMMPVPPNAAFLRWQSSRSVAAGHERFSNLSDAFIVGQPETTPWRRSFPSALPSMGSS
jgi:riboflavin kinase / FMN adenylyltransferase